MRIGIGTAQFGLAYGVANRQGQVARPVARQMLQLAAEYSVDTLDTAIAYGDSEACLGDIGVGDIGVGGFKLVTKLPGLPDDCTDVNGWVNEQLQASLDRLKADAVYGLLLHRPQQLLDTHGAALFQALQDIKQAGLAQKIGISVYGPAELETLIPRYRFDLVQAPFNLVDRRLHMSGWLQKLKDQGVEIHTRSAFLQGLLLMSRADIPAGFKPWASLWDKWNAWLEQRRVAALQACLAYPLSFAEVDRVIVGADSVGQLQQILQLAQLPAPAELPDLSCEEEKLINPALWSQQ